MTKDSEASCSSYSFYLHVGRPGDVEANHDGKKRPHYRRKGKRGYVHVAHLRRCAKRELGKKQRRVNRALARNADTDA